MGDISKHFYRGEFACRCGCGFDTVDAQLISVLEELREHFGVPIKVSSGCRCKEHNRAVGGSEKSQHLLARASDISMVDFTTAAICRYLEDKYPSELGIGKYDTFVHIDTRLRKARWTG